jgi:thiol-disulfide isomerase/thioredoxin
MKRFALVSLSLLAVGCDLQPAPAPAKVDAPVVTVGKQPAAAAPTATVVPAEVTLQFKNYDDVLKLIASKKGKLVVVDAWSTYCEPCMREFPGLVALHKKHGDKLACISLCANYAGLDKPEDVAAEPLEFLKAQGATFDNILSTDADTVLYKRLEINTVPSIFIYDRDGKLIKKFEGEPTYAQVEAFLEPLLK